MIKTFPLSQPPHLRTPESASRLTWRSVLALVPVWLVLLVRQPWETLRLSGCVFASAFLAEAAVSFLLKRKINFKDGSSFLWAFILALLLQGGTAGAILIAAAALFLGKTFFGGRTGVWVHPALLGYAFFVLSFPQAAFPTNGVFSFWNPFSGLWAALTVLALLSGGIFLTTKKNTGWEVPLIYLALIFIPCQFLGIRVNFSLPLVLLNAFWILPDPSTAPCSRRGRLYCAASAALLTLALDLLSVPASPVFGVLFLNLLTPWMDEWILPAGISFEASAQRARGMR